MLAVAGLHPASGGDGSQLCSGNMPLPALAARAGVTLRAVATSLGIEPRSGIVQVEGDLDFRCSLAVDKQTPVGFSRCGSQSPSTRLQPRSNHCGV